MIDTNNSSDQTVDIISALAHSSHIFYQTGSRYFGRNTNVSDFDFYTEDNNEVRAFLKDIGFMKVSKHIIDRYVDENCSSVYTYKNIDIQLTDDINLRIKANKAVKDFIDKDSHNARLFSKNSLEDDILERIWNLVYTLI